MLLLQEQTTAAPPPLQWYLLQSGAAVGKKGSRTKKCNESQRRKGGYTDGVINFYGPQGTHMHAYWVLTNRTHHPSSVVLDRRGPCDWIGTSRAVLRGMSDVERAHSSRTLPPPPPPPPGINDYDNDAISEHCTLDCDGLEPEAAGVATIMFAPDTRRNHKLIQGGQYEFRRAATPRRRMSGKRSRSFKCAVHHRDREVCSENDFHLIFEDPPLFKRMVHVIAMEVLPEERDRKYYADNYSCCPPPLFVILVTLVELGFFTYHTLTSGQADPAGPVPIDSMFIYRPDKRHEVWRFLFYMVLHAGWFHLGFNLVVQLLVGLPLEMVHGSTRIGCVYLAGVLAGSLGTSVFDPEVYLVGASGGVYALLAAHLANVMLNYRNMQYGIIRLLAIFLFASCDVGFAIYSRYAVEPESGAPSVSYVAHLTGALAGLTIGLLVLKNFEQKLHEQLLWWVALGVYAACTIFAVVFNLLNTVTVQRLEEEGEQVLKQHLFNNFGF
ncbi:hypothetical protein RP20_CCG005495 [Aedes albopictus]|nr:hypothetical protein RP20_CCG005495 [Aedes albopictus]